MGRDLISVTDLPAADVERILDRARALAEVSGRRTGNTSYQLAAERLSADVVTIYSTAASADKDESLKDTLQTLSAYDPSAIVIGSPHPGAAELAARWTAAPVINAGDGKHDDPTQALCDLYALRRRVSSLDGLRVWIVGDMMHSRVARSNMVAFTRMGCEVTVCGPPALIPRGLESLGYSVCHSLEGLDAADVVYILPMQKEWMEGSLVPSVHEYPARFQIHRGTLAPNQLLMHPGPVNRGVEVAGDVADSPQSLIVQQVEAGIIVRMAVLYGAVFDPGSRSGAHGRSTI